MYVYIYIHINATSYPPRNPKFDILCLDEYCRNPCSRRVLHGLDTSRSSSSVLSRAAPLSRVILHNWQASFKCTDAFVDDFDCKVTALPGTLHSFKEPLYPLKSMDAHSNSAASSEKNIIGIMIQHCLRHPSLLHPLSAPRRESSALLPLTTALSPHPRKRRLHWDPPGLEAQAVTC